MRLKKIRVLVVDDSAFMRKVISDILASDDSIEVVDTARDGLWALEKLKSVQADVITMDVEMPRMNGLEALKKINELYKIPVLMLSSITRAGTDITIKALELGAFDFVLKPSSGELLRIDSLKQELISKVKLCCLPGTGERGGKIPQLAAARKEESGRGPIKAVCIAASTGGPKALSRIMSMFPVNFRPPLLIVQHMPAGFTRAFAERLNNGSALTVKEAAEGDRIEQGTAYVAPGGYHMLVEGGRIKLDESPPMHGVRPCADKLFISAAENMGGRLIGIVLTGMGRDGTAGLEAIAKNGGICIAEDESTCTIFGMPKSAIEKGAAHTVLPLDRIVGEVLHITGS
jgi:two-component system chemotaxis response regulator CheB